MNNIDILEELKKNLDEILKEPMGQDEMSNGNLYEYERGYELDLQEIQAISNLISENKELKEENKHLIEINNKYNDMKYITRIAMLYIPKSKVEEVIKKYEWSIEHYDSDEADYRQSQDVGSWHALQSLLGKE